MNAVCNAVTNGVTNVVTNGITNGVGTNVQNQSQNQRFWSYVELLRPSISDSTTEGASRTFMDGGFAAGSGWS